jgi:hypothetical protein
MESVDTASESVLLQAQAVLAVLYVLLGSLTMVYLAWFVNYFFVRKIPQVSVITLISALVVLSNVTVIASRQTFVKAYNLNTSGEDLHRASVLFNSSSVFVACFLVSMNSYQWVFSFNNYISFYKLE